MSKNPKQPAGKKPAQKAPAKPRAKRDPSKTVAHPMPSIGGQNSDRLWHYSNPVLSTAWDAARLHMVAVAYFDWATDNPLGEGKPFAYQGFSWVETINKIRVFTLRGLQLFAGIDPKEWDEIKARTDLAPIVSWIDGVIYQQKFEAAAADLLNSNFIAKDLGLADRQELGGIPGQPLEVSARDTLLDRLSGIADRTRTE